MELRQGAYPRCPFFDEFIAYVNRNNGCSFWNVTEGGMCLMFRKAWLCWLCAIPVLAAAPTKPALITIPPLVENQTKITVVIPLVECGAISVLINGLSTGVGDCENTPGGK